MQGKYEIKRGVHIDDEDQKDANVYEDKMDAKRKRGNMEKNLDDMLFGGGMPAPRRRKPAEASADKSKDASKDAKPTPPPPEPVKPPVNKSTDSVNKSGDGGYRPAPPKKEPSIIAPGQPSGGGDIKTIPIISQQDINKKEGKFEPKGPAIVNKKPQEPIKETPAPPEEINFNDQLRPFSLRGGFNKPGFLRKGKKVAEDFNFADENPSQNSAIDVVKPHQTDRSRQQKLNDYDFKDYEFPAASSCLGNEHSKKESVWKQPKDIARVVNFGKYIDPNDLKPGVLSSPHFVSTLSALAEYQANTKRLIEDQKANGNGFYLVRLFINSVWRYIAVDQSLPYLDDQNAGVQSYPENDFELHSALIEKAYAKAFGSYGVFTALEARENYLRDLTGAPVKKVDVNSGDFASSIKRASAAGQIVMAVPNERIANYGFNPNLSYSVISFTSKGGLQLRSSFGTIEERSKIPIRPEGSFELSSVQMREVISHVLISTTNTAYFTTTQQGTHKFGFYSSYNFKIDSNVQGFITASQWDKRFYPESSGYDYSPLHLVLQKTENDGHVSFVNAAFTHASRNTDIEVDLTPGNYTVFVAGNWKTAQQCFHLTFYGSQRVDFSRIHTEKEPNLISQGLESLNLEEGRRSDQGRNINQYFLYEPFSNIVIVTVENNSDRASNASYQIGRVDLNKLVLLTCHNNEENYSNKVGTEVEEYKAAASYDRRWSVYLEPQTRFTWVLAPEEPYKESNPRSWGLK